MVFICSLTTYAQVNDSIPSILLDVQKDYLYHLIQLNSGTNTILRFGKPIVDDVYNMPTIKDSVKIKLQIEKVVNTRFYIDEIDTPSPRRIKASVYFIRDNRWFYSKIWQ